MVYYSGEFKGNNTIMPKISLPKEERDENWYLQMAKFIYGYHYQSWLYNLSLHFPELRDYANGMQSSERYKPMLGITGTPKSLENMTKNDYFGGNHNDMAQSTKDTRKGYRNIKFEKMLAPMPKMVDKIIGLLEKQEFNISVSAIDKSSKRQKKSKRYELEYFMKHKDMIQELNQMAGVTLQKIPNVLPDNMQELDMIEKIGSFDLLMEKADKKCIDWTSDYSDNKEIRRRVLRDLIICNCAVVVDKIDEARKVVTWEHIDPDNLILEYSKGTNKYDSSFYGYQKFYSVVDIRILCPHISEEKIRAIAKTYCDNTSMGNNVQASNLDLPSVYTDMGYCNYNDVKIPVLYWEAKCQDIDYDDSEGVEPIKHYIRGDIVKENELKRGKVKQDEKGYFKMVEAFKKEKGKLCTNYCGHWIIDTEYTFDCNEKYINTFDQTSKDSTLSGHFYFLDGESFVKRGEPIADLWALAGYRLQNEIATALPTNSYTYDYNALDEVSIKLNTKVDDIVTKGQQSGRFFYITKANVIPGNTNQYTYNKPIEKLQGAGLKEAIQEFELEMNSANNQLMNLWGVDMISSNSKANQSETPVAIAEEQISSTSDVLKKLDNAYLSILDGLAYNTALRAMLIAGADKKGEEGIESGYKSILTDEEWEALNNAANPTKDRDLPAYFNIKIKAKLDKAIKAEILDTCKRMTAAGRNGKPALTPAEYLFIVDRLDNGGQVKEIEALLSYKQSEQDNKEMQGAKQSKQMDIQNAIELQQQKDKSDKERMILEADLELRNAQEIEKSKTLGKVLLEEKKTSNEVLRIMITDPQVLQELKQLSGLGMQPTGQPNGQPGQPQQQPPQMG